MKHIVPLRLVLSPSNGEVILKPTQDMVIGCYYLTLMINNNKSILKNGSQMKKEALLAFLSKKLQYTPNFSALFAF
jgi:DNA-directed RNA polymerase beta' subunit